MTKTEIILRSIFGASGQNLRPLAHAIDIAGELLFMQQVLMDDILVKDIYEISRRAAQNAPYAEQHYILSGILCVSGYAVFFMTERQPTLLL
ncbi:MAG: hypothetical protein LUG25_04155 [Oscillospiraceae bacterium]|nr:hypothetical protein [Oscillospiraceae bacterium]